MSTFSIGGALPTPSSSITDDPKRSRPPSRFVSRQTRGRTAANCFRTAGLNGRLGRNGQYLEQYCPPVATMRTTKRTLTLFASHFIAAFCFYFFSAEQRSGSAKESELRSEKKIQVWGLLHRVLCEIYRWGRFNKSPAYTVCQWLFCPWMRRPRAAGVAPHYTAFWKGYARLSEKKLPLFCWFRMSCFSSRIQETPKTAQKELRDGKKTLNSPGLTFSHSLPERVKMQIWFCLKILNFDKLTVPKTIRLINSLNMNIWAFEFYIWTL